MLRSARMAAMTGRAAAFGGGGNVRIGPFFSMLARGNWRIAAPRKSAAVSPKRLANQTCGSYKSFMEPRQSELIDNFSIVLEFDRHGWSRFNFLWAKNIWSFWVSDVFQDFANDMLTFCEAVLENTPFRLALCDEPGGAIIAVKPCIRQQHIIEFLIEEVADPNAGFDSSTVGDVVFSVFVSRKQLVTILISELWKVHVYLKEPGYQKDRDPFPHPRLIELNRRWHKGELGPSFIK